MSKFGLTSRSALRNSKNKKNLYLTFNLPSKY